MEKIGQRLVLWLCIACLPVCCWAQQGATAYDTYKEVDHTLSFVDSAGTRNIHLKIQYKSDSGVYNVYADGAAAPIKLYEPLNVHFFRNAIQHFVDTHWIIRKPITPSTVNELFLSIYYAKVLNEEPVWSGNLLLNQYVRVFNSRKGTDESETAEVIQEINTLQGRLSVVNSEPTSKLESFRRNAAWYLDSIRQLSVQKKDSLERPVDTGTMSRLKKQIHELEATSGNLSLITQELERYRISEKDILFARDNNKWLPDTVLQSLKTAYTGYWKLKDSIAAEMASINRRLLDLGLCRVKKISLQFERGFLERIQVWVEVDGRDEVYENIYAIGFSSIGNFRAFPSLRLFARNKINPGKDAIRLSDVFLNYDNLLDNMTRDYSPADTAINEWNPASSVIRLRKESLVNLFDSKIFTDLNGLRDNSPNGLVQIEIARRFNLRTQRAQRMRACDDGYAGYLNAWGALTKLENKQRYLSLRNADIAVNDTIVSPSYATTLDFLRYETAQLGVEVNAYLFDVPNNKLTFFLDIGGRYGLTPVIDAIRYVDSPGRVAFRSTTGFDSLRLEAHTFSLYPKISLEIFSQRRVGLRLSYQPQYTMLFSNNNFKQVSSYGKGDLSLRPIEPRARWNHMAEFFLRAETSRDAASRLFLRARFYWQQGDNNTFFSQFQIGYAYNIFFKK